MVKFGVPPEMRHLPNQEIKGQLAPKPRFNKAAASKAASQENRITNLGMRHAPLVPVAGEAIVRPVRMYRVIRGGYPKGKFAPWQWGHKFDQKKAVS